MVVYYYVSGSDLQQCLPKDRLDMPSVSENDTFQPGYGNYYAELRRYLERPTDPQEAWDLVGLTLITATCFVNSAWFPPAETKSKEKLNKVNSTTSQTYCVALVRSLLYSVSSGRDHSNMRRTMRCASAVATSRCTSTTALSRRGRSTSRMLRTGCSRTPAEGNISIDVTKLFFLFERAENEDFWCINCINPWGGLRDHVKNFCNP